MVGTKGRFSRRRKQKRRAFSWLMVLCMVMTMFSANLVSAATGDVPDHSKTLKDNKDGTYTLSLDVTGDAVKEPQKANVIVVFDTSSSMNTLTGNTEITYTPTDSAGGYWYQDNLYGLVDGEYVPLERTWSWEGYSFSYDGEPYTGQRYTRQAGNQTRLQAAEEAVNELAAALLGYNGQDGNPADTIEIALVDFANMAEIAQQPTTDYATFEAVVNSRNAGNNDRGTNWEAGLRTAATVDFDDNDPTYVIFVSDGNPTFYVNDYGQRGGSGQETNDNINTSYNQAVPAAEALTAIESIGTDRFYTIGVYGNVTRMENLTTASGAPAGNYYAASDTAALQAALAEILKKIEMSGIGNASITDGTTNQVESTSGFVELLEVDTDSFKYYRSGGTYGSDPVEWKSTDDPAPPEATFTDGSVKWDLSSIGVLENGVTYTVTFDCYPSQTALDYKARIQNGEKYEDVVPEEARAYFKADGSLETNTTASISYDDTRDEAGQQTSAYRNPDPVTTSAETLTVKKDWEGEEADVDSIEMTVLMDGKAFDTVTLTKANSWTESSFISLGIIKNGKVLTGAEGHDFSFAELDGSQYHWELDAPTVRPMLINGTKTMLIKEEGSYEAPEGAEKYTINGATYYADEDMTSLTATNHRRSNLNLTKAVTGEGAPADAEFPFTLRVNNSKAPSEEPADDPDHETDYWVWFSIYDTVAGATVKDATVTGATPEEGDTGYYYAKSGGTITVNMKAGWNLRFTNLPTETTYEFTEGTLPTGFTFKQAEQTGVTDSTFSGGRTTTGTVEKTQSSYAVKYTNEYTLVDVTAKKVWDDNKDSEGFRPDSLTLTLTGAPEGTTVPTPEITKSEDGATWTYTWKGMPKYDAAGEEITYTITEGTVPDGYTCETASVANGGTITNTHTPEYVSTTVKKEWADSNNQDGIRPTSIVMTLSNGQTVTLNASNEWTATISNLPKYKDGKEITYTWSEESVPTGYTASDPVVSGTTTTITNTHTPATTEATVKKVWDDANDQDGIRPESLTVTLSNGDTVTLNEGNEWTATISDLPKYANGKEITYTWDEGTAPEGYSLTGAAASGTVTTLTNKHTPAKIDVEVKKVWKDADDQDGKRPESIQVQLYAGEETCGDPVTLNEDNDWTYKWEGLDKCANGEEIEYTVGELEVEDYDSETTGDMAEGYVITNIHVPEVTDVTVKKVWNDADDQDGKRPESLKVTLSNGETVTLGESNGWEATIKDLPVYKAGKKIDYTWTEASVDGYELTGTAKDGYVTTLTNKHTPEKTSVKVTKTWDDADNRDKIRPDSVTVELFADGGSCDTATLSESNNWTYTWTGLDKYSNGTEIAYTIDEVDVEGYESETTGSAAKGYTIKNVHQAKPDRVFSDPPVQKVVSGRPPEMATFTFQMKAVTEGAPMPAGSEDGVKTVQITGSGSYEFGNMYYDEAGEWVYEISEVNDGQANYTYDNTVYTLTVKVTEVQDGSQVKLVKEETVTGGDGRIVFTNVYEEEPEPAPPTGDTGLETVALLGIGASAILLALLRKRRSAEK